MSNAVKRFWRPFLWGKNPSKRNLSHGKPRGAAIYLLKPLLYRLLPRAIEKLIVLDLDVALTPAASLFGLWRLFGSFPPDAVLGLAAEQAPTYGVPLRYPFDGRNGSKPDRTRGPSVPTLPAGA